MTAAALPRAADVGAFSDVDGVLGVGLSLMLTWLCWVLFAFLEVVAAPVSDVPSRRADPVDGEARAAPGSFVVAVVVLFMLGHDSSLCFIVSECGQIFVTQKERVCPRNYTVSHTLGMETVLFSFRVLLFFSHIIIARNIQPELARLVPLSINATFVKSSSFSCETGLCTF